MTSEALAERIIMITGPLGSRDGSWRVVEAVLKDAGYAVEVSGDRRPSQLSKASDDLKAVVLNPRYLDADASNQKPLGEKVQSFKAELTRGDARDASLLVVGTLVGQILIAEAFRAGANDAFTIAGDRRGVIQQFGEILPRVGRLAQAG